MSPITRESTHKKVHKISLQSKNYQKIPGVSLCHYVPQFLSFFCESSPSAVCQGRFSFRNDRQINDVIEFPGLNLVISLGFFETFVNSLSYGSYLLSELG